MLTHIVCFKYKPEVSDETRRDHRTRLAGLRTLAGVLDLKVGADVVHSARSFDTGLIVVFPDRAALDAYAVDPQHVPVAQFGAGLCQQIVAVDFE
ncbi:MAG: Dabb family protein [Vicinamibacterales bacterium]